VPITILGLSLSFVAGIGGVMRSRTIRTIALVYVELFRGTSAFVQIFFFFYILPLFGFLLDPITVGVLALGLNFGAYGSEIIRAGVRSVNRDQWEAAMALGLSYRRTLLRIVLPQALPSMLPAFGNLFVEYLKLTSLLSVIGILELTFSGRLLMRETGDPFAVWGLVLALYLVVALPLAIIVRGFERRTSIGMRVGRG